MSNDNDTLRAALRELLVQYRELEAGLISFGGQKRPDDMGRYEALAAEKPPAVEWRGWCAFVGDVWVGGIGRLAPPIGGWQWWYRPDVAMAARGEAPTEAEARAAVEAVLHD